MVIRPRRNEDLEAVSALLEAEQLPLDALEATEGWVAEEAGVLVGHVALEAAGDAVLVRSLVVAPASRGQGLGERLMQAAEAAAGARPRYLKTDTVGPWMVARGYRLARPEEIPAGIQATSQFAGGACTCACTPVLVQGLPSAPKGPGFLARGGWLIPALPLWLLVYRWLEPAANLLTTGVFHLRLDSRLGSAVAFFAYDAPKVLMLLSLVVLGVTFVQTFLSPERTRDILARRAGAWGNLLGSLLGIVTPFCSCSAVPLFIGFVRVGVPLGVTFSYLVSAPMVNEVALFLLLGLFGWKIALLYAGTGVAVAFLAGWVIGKLRMERHLEGWVMEIPYAAQAAEASRLGFPARLEIAVQGVRDIVGKVWPYLLAGIAVGAFIHGYAPEALMARIMGKAAWWSVPLAVLIGVPLYSNAAGVIPIVQALLGKGAALGTVLAFMMAVTGLSLPETIILRKVLKPRLIAVFIAVVTAGILLVGYLFNALL